MKTRRKNNIKKSCIEIKKVLKLPDFDHLQKKYLVKVAEYSVLCEEFINISRAIWRGDN